MTVAPEHIDRIADFVDARIDEQFTGNHTSRAWDEDPASRTLRALRRAVEEIRSRKVLAEQRDEPGLAVALDLVLTFAWGELAAIAKQWADHSDYQDEFSLLAHQLTAIPAASETP
jgi:hypothetical protein